MKISPKRSLKFIFEENLTQQGMPREAGSAKQQGQGMSRQSKSRQGDRNLARAPHAIRHDRADKPDGARIPCA